ncbi:MAG: FAD-dependent monooxygenase [Elusimicrobia bacterium]|nr:FAD-dependent monooxygenase [Elusimicrobiota bacterium]
MSDEMNFDCIVVGAGPAGISAAITLAKAGLSVVVLERGAYPGAKNVQGAVLYTHQLAEVLPEFWKDPQAALERPITEQRTVIATEDSWVSVGYKSEKYLKEPHNCYTIIRVRFDQWFSKKAEEAGAEIYTGVTVRDVARKDGKICGVKTGDGDELLAPCVIACDGVNSILAQKAGLIDELKPSEVALGAKEILSLPAGVIEDRFNLEKGEGATTEMFGALTQGMLGYVFLYTNKDTLSLGVGCKLTDYQKKGLRPSEHLEAIKQHPFVRRLIAGSKTLEYSAHLIPEGGMRSMPPLYTDGFLIAGDAAQMVNPAFREGSNMAMTAGKLAAETVIEAKKAGDFSAAKLSAYEDKLKESYLWPDLEEVQDVEAWVEARSGFLDFYPKLACDLAHLRFTVDGQPKKGHLGKAFSMIQKRGAVDLAKDAWMMLKLGKRLAI